MCINVLKIVMSGFVFMVFFLGEMKVFIDVSDIFCIIVLFFGFCDLFFEIKF